jgi:hypothetical protein
MFQKYFTNFQKERIIGLWQTLGKTMRVTYRPAFMLGGTYFNVLPLETSMPLLTSVSPALKTAPVFIASDIADLIVRCANFGMDPREVLTRAEAFESYSLRIESVLRLGGEWSRMNPRSMALHSDIAGVYVYGDYLHIVCRGQNDEVKDITTFLFNRVS